MSLGYAEKLSFREDLGGQLGAPECFDSPEDVERKVEHLAALVRNSGNMVAFTGAGISTSCGIPDFRGPSGIWTLQRAGKPLPRPKVSFAVARPSYTHAALVTLMESGKLKYIVSQNVDGLHLRSGVPRKKLAELHGNCFAERCIKCKTEYIRDFEVETVGFKPTGRKCTKTKCGGQLHDHVLDWEDALPEKELRLSEKYAKEADLAICLGTSLQITPACNLPLKTIKKYKDKETPGKLVIVNLQRTQHDKKAEASGGLVIRAKADDVMRLLMDKLQAPVSPYVREDSVLVRHHLQKEPAEEVGRLATLKLAVHSRHGPDIKPLPMVRSVSFHFKGSAEPVVLLDPPFEIHREIECDDECVVKIKLELEAADRGGNDDSVSMVYTAAREAMLKSGDLESAQGEQEWSFVSQVVHYHNFELSQVQEEEGALKKPRLE